MKISHLFFYLPINIGQMNSLRPCGLALILLLAACTQAPAVTATPSSTASPFAPAQSATPSSTPAPTAIPPTPAPPPQGFPGDMLRTGVLPVSYIADQCEYLSKRWDPEGSPPGTVVAVVMYHSILEGNTTPTLSQDINAATFNDIVQTARQLGFETITSADLLAFLTENASIPKRAMLPILDDRKPGTAQKYFLPLYEQYGWSTTLAWIIGDTDQRTGEHSGESMWAWVERLNATGAFDVQSHGLNHIPIVEGQSAEFLQEELGANIPILEAHFGQRPIAHIWAGGNFTAAGVAAAQAAGYQLGFTVQSRGPLLFNWIPQGEPERSIGSPLLLLPRFWDTAATLNLRQTAEIGDAARQFARSNYAAEAAWFEQNCGGELPPLAAVLE